MNKKEETPDQSGVLEKVKQLDPERNVLYAAVEQLSGPDEIKQFVQEYVDYKPRQGSHSGFDYTADQVAAQDRDRRIRLIGEIRSVIDSPLLGDNPSKELWEEAIETIEQP
jgi:hypothetical protein